MTCEIIPFPRRCRTAPIEPMAVGHLAVLATCFRAIMEEHGIEAGKAIIMAATAEAERRLSRGGRK